MKRDIGSKPTIVYQAVNLINGKRYIGITAQSLAGRRSGHKNGYRRGRQATVFDCAIRHHGIENFGFAILKRCPNRLEAAREEVRLIADLRPEYNMSTGGDTVMAPSQEQFAIFIKGRDRASHRRKKPVICLSDGKIFASSAEAADAYGISRSTLCVHLKGRGLSASKKLFAYFTGAEKKLSDPEAAMATVRAGQRARFLQANTSKSPPVTWNSEGKRKPIVCVTDGREFRSLTDASKFYNIGPTQLSRVANQVHLSAHGLIFAWKGEESKPRREDVRKYYSAPPAYVQEKLRDWMQQNHVRPVRCLSDGKEYPSILTAAQAYSLSVAVVSYAATRGDALKWSKHKLQFTFMKQ